MALCNYRQVVTRKGRPGRSIKTVMTVRRGGRISHHWRHIRGPRDRRGLSLTPA